mgnify:CR=1 FL=1
MDNYLTTFVANCRKIVFDLGADAVLTVADVNNSFDLLSVWFGIIILANLLVDCKYPASKMTT